MSVQTVGDQGHAFTCSTLFRLSVTPAAPSQRVVCHLVAWSLSHVTAAPSPTSSPSTVTFTPCERTVYRIALQCPTPKHTSTRPGRFWPAAAANNEQPLALPPYLALDPLFVLGGCCVICFADKRHGRAKVARAMDPECELPNPHPSIKARITLHCGLTEL